MPKPCLVALALFSLLLPGCNTETHLPQTDPKALKIYYRFRLPKQPYFVLATLTDVEDYVPEGGNAAIWSMKGAPLENLRMKAAILGADGLILTQAELTDPAMDTVGASTGETTKLWLTAQAIRFDRPKSP